MGLVAGQPGMNYDYSCMSHYILFLGVLFCPQIKLKIGLCLHIGQFIQPILLMQKC